MTDDLRHEKRTYCQDPEHIALPPIEGVYCSGPHTPWPSSVAECPERAQHYLMSLCGTCGYPNGGRWQKTVTELDRLERPFERVLSDGDGDLG